jgi:hypothetical protein
MISSFDSTAFAVIPAKAGIQDCHKKRLLDARFHGHDEFLRTLHKKQL